MENTLLIGILGKCLIPSRGREGGTNGCSGIYDIGWKIR